MNYKNENWLSKQYLIEKLSAKDIGKLCGVSDVTILNWLRKFRISRRSQAESLRNKYRRGYKNPKKGVKLSESTKKKISKNHADFSGENNPMWGKRGKEAPAFGKVRTKEHRQKLSKALIGKKRPDMVGSNNPNWKGGKTTLSHKIRTSNRYIEWRLAVYTRDNFTCQNCGDNQGGNLNAHHLIHFSDLLEAHGIKSIAEASATPQLWETDLGITLCEKCHEKEHRTKS
jgi:hypothetical protein